MKPILALVALVAFIVACAAPVEAEQGSRFPSECGRTFIVSPGFPDAEQIALRRAVVRWNDIAVEKFCVRGAEDSEMADRIPLGVYPIDPDSEYYRLLAKQHGGDFLGIYFSSTSAIGIVDNLDEQLFELVALHELGHAHALGHTEAPSIMHAAAGTATDFTPNDLAECQRVGACPKEDEDG